MAGPERLPIFLSASIPKPDRDPRWLETMDRVAIREAVLALVAATVRERKLVFGGHPAISPLVENAARSLDAVANVHIYQSLFFEKYFTDEARAFENFHTTRRCNDMPESLAVMRQEMIGAHAPFAAAVFIGGMEGVIDEHQIFVDMHREQQAAQPVILPVASTGAAARDLWQQGVGPSDPEQREALATDRRYRALFRRLLRDLP